MAANSAEAIKELGATEEYVVEMLTLYTIQQKMYEAIILDGIEKSIQNFRKYQLNKISSDIELIEPELL